MIKENRGQSLADGQEIRAEAENKTEEQMECHLNEEQTEAVVSTEGLIRVIAGAGSGKTRALTERFAYLVNEAGVLPGNILCVTFTNKAANEMRQRIHQLTGDNDTGFINTFHGFCVSVLQEDGHVVSYPKNFLVLDNSDIDVMLQTIYDERGLSMRDMTFSHARDMIEMIKLKERPDYYLDMISSVPGGRAGGSDLEKQGDQAGSGGEKSDGENRGGGEKSDGENRGGSEKSDGGKSGENRSDGAILDVLYAKYMAAQKPKDIIFYGYLYQEKKCFGLDYNDLLKFALHIFNIDEEVRLKWQKRHEYIMIDEFQDIDKIQYELMEVLRGYHNNLFVVGDPDQTIYSWRGADGKYLMDFDQSHEGSKTIMMMKNYRSTPQVLAVANSLISKNKSRIKKDIIPTLGPGKKVSCHYAGSRKEEAKYIAEKIRQITQEGGALRDITVMYRAHYLTRTVEEELIKQKIPYRIYSGAEFFARKEVRDAIAYLRMIVYKDDLSFVRICNTPRRNIGRRRMEFLKAQAEQTGLSLYEVLKENLEAPEMKGTQAAAFVSLIEEYSEKTEGRQISDVLAAILNDSGYEAMLRKEGAQDRLDNLAELKQSVYDYEATCGEEAEITHYLSHVAMFSNSDAEDHADKVRLMTVHAAKGLEFSYVILCGMNEGIFPSKKIQTLEEMEEERRLAFVAVTRAEKELHIVMAEGMGLDGSPMYPSRFVLDVDQDLLEYTSPLPEFTEKAARSNIAMKESILAAEAKTDLFAPGDRVRGAVFGAGTIIDVDVAKKKYVIRFDDLGTEREITFRAKLERI